MLRISKVYSFNVRNSKIVYPEVESGEFTEESFSSYPFFLLKKSIISLVRVSLSRIIQIQDNNQHDQINQVRGMYGQRYRKKNRNKEIVERKEKIHFWDMNFNTGKQEGENYEVKTRSSKERIEMTKSSSAFGSTLFVLVTGTTNQQTSKQVTPLGSVYNRVYNRGEMFQIRRIQMKGNPQMNCLKNYYLCIWKEKKWNQTIIHSESQNRNYPFLVHPISEDVCFLFRLSSPLKTLMLNGEGLIERPGLSSCLGTVKHLSAKNISEKELVVVCQNNLLCIWNGFEDLIISTFGIRAFTPKSQLEVLDGKRGKIIIMYEGGKSYLYDVYRKTCLKKWVNFAPKNGRLERGRIVVPLNMNEILIINETFSELIDIRGNQKTACVSSVLYPYVKYYGSCDFSLSRNDLAAFSVTREHKSSETIVYQIKFKDILDECRKKNHQLQEFRKENNEEDSISAAYHQLETDVHRLQQQNHQLNQKILKQKDFFQSKLLEKDQQLLRLQQQVKKWEDDHINKYHSKKYIIKRIICNPVIRKDENKLMYVFKNQVVEFEYVIGEENNSSQIVRLDMNSMKINFSGINIKEVQCKNEGDTIFFRIYFEKTGTQELVIEYENVTLYVIKIQVESAEISLDHSWFLLTRSGNILRDEKPLLSCDDDKVEAELSLLNENGYGIPFVFIKDFEIIMKVENMKNGALSKRVIMEVEEKNFRETMENGSRYRICNMRSLLQELECEVTYSFSVVFLGNVQMKRFERVFKIVSVKKK